MGEHELQRLIAEVLRPMIERWFASQRRLAHVGADQFFYWEEGNAKKRLAPDVYVVPGVAQNPPVASWKLWEMRERPSWAFEIVGQDIDKDYEVSPRQYQALGVDELVLFDPHTSARSRRRRRWQVFRAQAGGAFERVVLGASADRVESRALGCWLREVNENGRLLVRLATGPRGEDLVPTELEQVAAEREQAEAEIARLREELAALRADRAR
jgi:hypothetical protein